MKETQHNLEKKDNSSILKVDFSSRTDRSFSPSIAPESVDLSSETNRVFPALKSRSHFLPSPQCLVDPIQVQKPTLVVDANLKLDHTMSSHVISIDSNITDKIVRRVINVKRKKLWSSMESFETPAFRRYSSEDFQSRTTQSRLLRRSNNFCNL